MSAITDLISQIADARLRDRLSSEWRAATETRKFGLVFEDHLPELVPLYGIAPKKGDLVAKRTGRLTDTFRITELKGSKATCLPVSPSAAKAQAGSVELPTQSLVVVREFGQPIYPALTPVDEVNERKRDAVSHAVIEADNYHALQLLQYLYPQQVDCIYIDPPYNTGAKDWKYNNDYVDSNDNWRHSKWLAFMEKRLRLAKTLLKPQTGTIVVTIDEHEVHHLRMLLEAVFPERYHQMVTIVINPKGVTQGRFSRVEEYALYCFGENSNVVGYGDDLLSIGESKGKANTPRWKGLLRSGTNARRVDRDKMFYPVLIDEKKNAIVGAGDYLPLDKNPKLGAKVDGYAAAWPIRTDGTLGNWGVGPKTLRELIAKGYVALGGFDPSRKTWGISYLSKKLQNQIQSGAIRVVARDPVTNVVEVEYAEERERQIKTVWHRSLHDAGAYGADVLKTILGEGRKFSFPKSIYATRDAISAVVKDNKEALIVDFFAGSGTTLNAVNLLNATDGGHRRCVLVTNNEVSSEEAASLEDQGFQPGTTEWERNGICQSVTWPRTKFSTTGKRADGTPLDGEYFTGRVIEKTKKRKFVQVALVSPDELATPKKKKELLLAIDALPQSLVTRESSFVVSEKHDTTVLFAPEAADEWLEELEGNDHITRAFIVTRDKEQFRTLADAANEAMGPLVEEEDEKRSMSLGFDSRATYFRLSFLDKNRVALKRAFREILPLLWLQSGSVGSRPKLPRDTAEPEMLVPTDSNFAVLLQEGLFGKFVRSLTGAANISTIYIVTDSEETFRTLAERLNEKFGRDGRQIEIRQLYRDYLSNFAINLG